MKMTGKEIIVLAIDIFLLIVANIMMWKRKEALYESKNLWLYFAGVKLTIVLPAILTAMQMYVFAFGYVAKVGSAMHYLIMYCYIGYLLLGGFIIFMAENQVNLLRLMSVLMLAYQSYMSYQIFNNKAVMTIMGDSVYNLFSNGDTLGSFLACLGPLLSLGAVITCWHYWKKNSCRDFTIK